MNIQNKPLDLINAPYTLHFWGEVEQTIPAHSLSLFFLLFVGEKDGKEEEYTRKDSKE